MRRNIGESTVAIVVKESAGGKTGHIQIREAIVIEITDSDSHPVEVDVIHTSLGCDIFELPVAQVAVKRILYRIRALAAGSLASIHEANIRQSIVIKIEEGNSSSHGFDQKAIWRFATELPPGDPRFLGDVCEKFFGRNCEGGERGGSADHRDG